MTKGVHRVHQTINSICIYLYTVDIFTADNRIMTYNGMCLCRNIYTASYKRGIGRIDRIEKPAFSFVRQNKCTKETDRKIPDLRKQAQTVTQSSLFNNRR